MTDSDTKFELLHEVDLSPARKGMDTVFKFKDSGKLELRIQQHQFIYSAYEGIKSGRDVVIEGPTGLGKTRSLISAVFPALEEDNSLRVLYLTRTKTQVQNIINEIYEISTLSIQKQQILSATPYMGRDAIRSISGVTSDNHFGESLTPNRSGVLTFPEIQKEATNGSCPFDLIRKASRVKRIVVAPHGCILDDIWLTNAGFVPEKTIVLMDEAHNFVTDICNDFYLTVTASTQKKEGISFLQSILSRTDIRTNKFIAKDVNKGIQGCKWWNNNRFHAELKRLLELTSELLEAVGEVTANLPVMAKTSPPSTDMLMEDAYHFHELFVQLGYGDVYDNALRTLENALASSEISKLNYYLRRQFVISKQFLQGLSLIIEHPFEFYINYNIEHRIFTATAIHPKHIINRAMEKARCGVFTSATISPVQDFAFLLGRSDPITIKIDHLFSDKNYKHFYVCGINSSSKPQLTDQGDICFSKQEQRRVLEAVSKAVNAAEGKNIGIFFNNLNLVKWMASQIKYYGANFLPKDTVTLGQVGNNREKWSDSERYLVDQFQSALKKMKVKRGSLDPSEHVADLFMWFGDKPNTTLLLGVQGGKLAEGIDYSGTKMEMVICVGLPYPGSPNEVLVSSIKRDYWAGYFDGEPGKADDFSYKHDAFRKLTQSAGRAHRSTKDRAIIVFIDERLMGIKNNGAGN
ncbi:MAG: DEAD/DEAH box helicase [Candidatus Electrothrix sp. AW3_4]|nr:DEAD/DEAH box helicase [Candidatus Electrothrix gigas]